MVKTHEGRALLQGLVDTLMRKMAPVITAANRILKNSGPRVLSQEKLIHGDSSSGEASTGDFDGISGANVLPASTFASTAASSSIDSPQASELVLENILSGNPFSHLADEEGKGDGGTHEQLWSGFLPERTQLKPLPEDFDISAIFEV